MNQKQRRQRVENEKEAERIGAYYDRIDGLIGELDGVEPKTEKVPTVNGDLFLSALINNDANPKSFGE